jgi:hypothetical protein
MYKASFEWKRDDTEFTRITGGENNYGQII